MPGWKTGLRPGSSGYRTGDPGIVLERGPAGKEVEGSLKKRRELKRGGREASELADGGGQERPEMKWQGAKWRSELRGRRSDGRRSWCVGECIMQIAAATRCNADRRCITRYTHKCNCRRGGSLRSRRFECRLATTNLDEDSSAADGETWIAELAERVVGIMLQERVI